MVERVKEKEKKSRNVRKRRERGRDAANQRIPGGLANQNWHSFLMKDLEVLPYHLRLINQSESDSGMTFSPLLMAVTKGHPVAIFILLLPNCMLQSSSSDFHFSI